MATQKGPFVPIYGPQNRLKRLRMANEKQCIIFNAKQLQCNTVYSWTIQVQECTSDYLIIGVTCLFVTLTPSLTQCQIPQHPNWYNLIQLTLCPGQWPVKQFLDEGPKPEGNLKLPWINIFIMFPPTRLICFITLLEYFRPKITMRSIIQDIKK